MSRYRVTIEILKSGQPRAYADHIGHVRATFEAFRSWCGDDNDSRSGWEPNKYLNEDQVKDSLRGLRCGFPVKEPENWADTQLTAFENVAPGVWEFWTRTAYTG